MYGKVARALSASAGVGALLVAAGCSQPASYSEVDLSGSYNSGPKLAYSGASGLPVQPTYLPSRAYTEAPRYPVGTYAAANPAPHQNLPQVASLDPSIGLNSLPQYNSVGSLDRRAGAIQTRAVAAPAPTLVSLPSQGVLSRDSVISPQTILAPQNPLIPRFQSDPQQYVSVGQLPNAQGAPGLPSLTHAAPKLLGKTVPPLEQSAEMPPIEVAPVETVALPAPVVETKSLPAPVMEQVALPAPSMPAPAQPVAAPQPYDQIALGQAQTPPAAPYYAAKVEAPFEEADSDYQLYSPSSPVAAPQMIEAPAPVAQLQSAPAPISAPAAPAPSAPVQTADISQTFARQAPRPIAPQQTRLPAPGAITEGGSRVSRLPALTDAYPRPYELLRPGVFPALDSSSETGTAPQGSMVSVPGDGGQWIALGETSDEALADAALIAELESRAFQIAEAPTTEVDNPDRLGEDAPIVILKTAEAIPAREPFALASAQLPEAPFNAPIQSAAFSWPVHGEVYRLTEGQLDIRAQQGSRVTSAAGGVVSHVEGGAQGMLVVIEHSNGWRSLMLGLDGVTPAIGQRVSSGEIIGTVGAQGRLRLELRDGNQQVADALGVLKG